MGYSDLILFPLFVFLSGLYFKRARRKLNNPLLVKYHRQGYWIKMFSCLAFIIYSVYLSPGDSIGLYQKEGNHLYHLILNDESHWKWLFTNGKYFDESLALDPWNKGYFRAEANFIVIKIVAFLSFFTFGSYAAISVIFASIAYAGIWKLFLFFYYQRPNLHKKFALAIIYFPTIVFWSSGIMKDPLCIAAVGFMTYYLYEIFYNKKKIIRNGLLATIAICLLAVIKVYILISYLPFFIFFIILKYLEGIHTKLLRYLIAPFLIAGSMYGFTLVIDSYQEQLGAFAIEELAESIEHMNVVYNAKDGKEDASSNFDLGVEFDGSMQGLVKVAPAAILATFYRPFIWESKKMSSLIASLESLVLLFFTFYLLVRCRIYRLIGYIFSDSLLMFCLLFAIVFATFIGASTLNFGTLVRYKIPCLPFYVIFLMLAYEKVKERLVRKQIKKATSPQEAELQLSPAFT
jgi:hypothetical protein